MVKNQDHKKWSAVRLFVTVLCSVLWLLGTMQTVFAADPIKIAYYYEEVCASCDGTKDFFELYNRVISSDDKKLFQAEISTYNVFMDSCKVQYEGVKKELEIPSGTSLPVLVIGDQWISGHDNMELQMRDVIMNSRELSDGSEVPAETQMVSESADVSEIHADAADYKTIDETGNAAFWADVKSEIEAADLPVVLLFSTNNCEDCSAVKQWFSRNEMSLQVLEYNIIEDNCLYELKAVFNQYQVPEETQKVPAVFWGENYLIGKDDIPTIGTAEIKVNSDNKELLKRIEEAEAVQIGNKEDVDMNLLTLAAAGLLAGFNPCSISMLLMLLSLLLSEKASIWKSGILYLIGKYAAYISIGLAIFMTASQISDQTMERVGNAMNLVMGILFAVAAVFYILDAVRVYRQDYGNIKMQLPVGLRRMNHNLIKKVSSAGGVMQPLMILVLGIVISFGEFFCTGQIYMASITYLLKDQVKAAVLPFLVYTTAMSIPAVIMILLIQKTRNTDAVSDFMFRHLGVIKIFNAVLFILFSVYFLVF